MAKKRKAWTISPLKGSKPSVPASIKAELEAKAAALIENVLKPKHVLPPPKGEQFNYSAVRRFDPGCGDNWTKFIEWSRLTQLREVISLDMILCPTVFKEVTDEDWQYNVQEDFKLNFFYKLDYVLGKLAGRD